MKQINRHPLFVAACNLLLVMALYTLSRGFFYATNLDLYPDVEGGHLMELLLGGMRFDLTAILYLSSVYLLLTLLPLPATWRNQPVYQAVAKWFYLVPNAIGLVVNTADMAYIRFTDRRTTCTFFAEFQHDGNIGQILGQGVVHYWYLTLFGLLLLAALWWGYRRYQAPQATTQRGRLLYYLSETAIMLVSVYFVIIGIRGGFGAYTRPITISNAMQYVRRPAETSIVLNTPFSLMKSLENETYKDPGYFAAEEMERIMTPLHAPASAQHADSLSSPISHHLPPTRNVVVLILESFAKEHFGFYNPDLDEGSYSGYTPFLDSLLQQSVTYTHSFASGRKSIDAMPSVLSSIPMLIEPYVVTPYSTNAVSSLADVLSREGYTTAFFHGAPNGSMGFQAYARAAGFANYYGMNEYNGPEAFDGTWAIWDEEFLQYYCRTMSGMQEPFCTAVFTASSHDPFHIPQQYEGRFPDGPKPLCRCIAYSDYALQRFFEEAKKQPWYDHTLFVLTADHTNQNYHPEYLNDQGFFAVPIAFYTPGIQPRVDSLQVVSQTDIMPSVLAYLGYQQPYFAFGEDALTQPKTHNYAICYNHPFYQIMSTKGYLQFDGTQVVRVSGDLSEQEQADMLQFLKAYIQQYISRMINNQLTR